MALPGGEVVIVMVEGLVESLIIGRDTGYVVKGLEELLCLVQVSLPLGVGARLDDAEEVRSNLAAVLRL